jgi:hypothetical protein
MEEYEFHSFHASTYPDKKAAAMDMHILLSLPEARVIMQKT